MGRTIPARLWLAAGFLAALSGAAIRLLVPDLPLSEGAAVLLALAWLAVCSVWQARSPSLGPMPSKVGLGGSMPLALVPMMSIGVAGPASLPVGQPTSVLQPAQISSILGSDVVMGAAVVLATTAIAVACLELTRRVPGALGRPIARIAVMTLFAGALLLAWAGAAYTVPWQAADALDPSVIWWVLTSLGIWTASAAAVLAVVGRARSETSRPVAAVLGYVGIGIALCGASFAMVGGSWVLVTAPALAVAIALILVGRFAAGPLELEVEAITMQRDLVVSSVEAERRRIVADIHDGPLVELAHLIHWLDEAQDEEGATLARSVASDLRTLGNALRVPVLEDLGAGPAIQWLSTRIAERTGTEIETTIDVASGRPPASVEGAVFRIAQEALVNAAKHGAGPVQVFYLSEPDHAQLAVIDSGPGIEPAARSASLRDGHLGLSLMAQRAAAIGARLEVTAAKPRGTCVELVWGAS